MQRERRRGLAGCHRQRGRASLERRNPPLEDTRRRIHDPRVDVAKLLQREQARGMGRILELIRRGLVDRHRDRAGGGIGAIARVEDQRFRMLAVSGHGIP